MPFFVPLHYSYGYADSDRTDDKISEREERIEELNEALDDSPEKVNSDPFDEGWLIKVTPSNPEEKDELMNFLSYEEFVS